MICVGHLVEDVGIVDGDTDGEPEDLLPRLVGFMENEVPAYIIQNTALNILSLPWVLHITSDTYTYISLFSRNIL